MMKTIKLDPRDSVGFNPNLQEDTVTIEHCLKSS